MIYCSSGDLRRYYGLSESLDAALGYLAHCDLSMLAQGQNEVRGEEIFINRFGYDTLPEEQTAWEGHIRYADIHVLLSGEERIGVANRAALTETGRDEAVDFVDYTGEADVWLPMLPGKALILFPEDAHRVKVRLNGPAHVEKAVFKVRV